jgi:hypothetical protein
MRNLLWRLTAVALDVPLLMLSLFVEWRMRLRPDHWWNLTCGPPAPPGGEGARRTLARSDGPAHGPG